MYKCRNNKTRSGVTFGGGAIANLCDRFCEVRLGLAGIRSAQTRIRFEICGDMPATIYRGEGI
jgi:hypothetical protein